MRRARKDDQDARKRDTKDWRPSARAASASTAADGADAGACAPSEADISESLAADSGDAPKNDTTGSSSGRSGASSSGTASNSRDRDGTASATGASNKSTTASATGASNKSTTGIATGASNESTTASATGASSSGSSGARRRVVFRQYEEYTTTAKSRSAEADVTSKQDFLRKQQWVKNARAWDSPLWWCVLALLRLLLAVVQTGYIHPDEFHQSVQVRARDVLQIEGQKPWEYTSSTPIRSIVFSGFISLPFTALRALSPYASQYLGWTLLTPSVLLVAPRLFITLLSFFADLCVYKIARICYIRPWQCMEVFASSYVMLVYATRTFSNTLELILMCVVLWRVSLSIVESSKVIRKECIIQDLYESVDEIRDKVRLVRMKGSLPPYNYGDSFLLSVVITYGSFVRPTFIIYTFVPVAYWLQRGIITRELDFKYFNRRCFSLVPGVVLTFLLCVLSDSFYYESLSAKEFVYGNVTANSFIVTPMNFFLYNKEPKNLAQHGQHPHYLHVLVNLPLLHGVLAFVGLFYTSMYVSNLFGTSSITKKPKLYSLASMMLLSLIVPVIALSLFPHQEARFLLPTLPCLILLHSDKVSLHNVFKLKFSKHFLFLMWHTWNIFCVVFFGFLHQGAVTKAMISVHDYVQNQPTTFQTPIHVYFSHMYTPPTFLLMRKIEVLASTEQGRKFKVPRSVYSHHLSGSTTATQINDILYTRLSNASTVAPAAPTKHGEDDDDYYDELDTAALHQAVVKANKASVEVLLVLPGSVATQLSSHNQHYLQYSLVQRLPLHVTLEHLPDFTLRYTDMSDHCNELCATKNKLLQFSLEIYKVELPPDGALWQDGEGDE